MAPIFVLITETVKFSFREGSARRQHEEHRAALADCGERRRDRQGYFEP